MNSIELFAGAGGFETGICRAGFRPAAVIEKNEWCCETLSQNSRIISRHFLNENLFCADVRDFNFSDFSAGIDLISGGPPCQPFSLGGKHRSYLDQRDMFPQAIRAVREVLPKAFIFENVKGLIRPKFQNYFEYIRLQLSFPSCVSKNGEEWVEHLGRLEDLQVNGMASGPEYRVVARVLNAADYGIPQIRNRIFFVGFRNDLGVHWHFPEPTHSLTSLLQDQISGKYWEKLKVPKKERVIPSDRYRRRAERELEKDELAPWATVRAAIHDLPDPMKAKKNSSTFLNHDYKSGAKSYKGHTGSFIDEPAKTLKAGVNGVPGGENMLRNIDGTVRYFTVRECARLQTFPDNFEFHGSWTETLKQLGNAVPVELADILATEIRKSIIKAE